VPEAFAGAREILKVLASLILFGVLCAIPSAPAFASGRSIGNAMTAVAAGVAGGQEQWIPVLCPPWTVGHGERDRHGARRVGVAGGILWIRQRRGGGGAQLGGRARSDVQARPGWGIVQAVARQTDGKILIAATFPRSARGSELGNRIARLNADGTLDPGFSPALEWGTTGPGIAVQSDGRILIGGAFSVGGGVTRETSPVNANGSPDTTFNCGLGQLGIHFKRSPSSRMGKLSPPDYFSGRNGLARCTPMVRSIAHSCRHWPATQPCWPWRCRKTAKSSSLATFRERSEPGVVRLHPDGSRDAGFNPGTGPAGNDVAFVRHSPCNRMARSWPEAILRSSAA